MFERGNQFRKGLRPANAFKKGHSGWNKNKTGVYSKETIEKMSESHKGHKHSQTTKEKIGKTLIEKRTGENNPNWKGGITPENKKIRAGIEFRLWREAIFARDNWTCQKCLIKGGRLHPHHIKNFAQYPELRFAIDNGITFCKDCHKKFHQIYGKKNNTKEQILEFSR